MAKQKPKPAKSAEDVIRRMTGWPEPRIKAAVAKLDSRGKDLVEAYNGGAIRREHLDQLLSAPQPVESKPSDK